MAKIDRKLVAIGVVAVLILLFVLIQAPGFIKKERPNATVTGEFPQSKSGENITVAELQRSVNTASSFQKLGSDARILIKFYDGSGQELGQPRFLVGGGGTVEEVTSFVLYDVALITGDYYINEIKSTNDICGLLKRIKQNQDFNVELNVDPITAQVRYGSLAECVPFS